ncbi:enolase C-terminal domain-like protein [Streptomyces sp. AC512_CC834]|uniref:enolase C-terminal domain-like protein n=1 Tax=Streptomyces sp. AC512_CC834 TaxID=2823691 RepID=UPI001C26E233|nr:enolase C-terminal domain-like protein [Streptomyces sp. AC512_CC834]
MPSLPLVTPFRTSLGIEYERSALLVHVTASDAEGRGECVAGADAGYSSEYVEGAEDVTARTVGPLLAAVKGHRMAKAALETAVLDAELRSHAMSFAAGLGAVADRVPSGVSVGIMDSVPELLDAVEGYLEQGHVRIKLKIEPGWDLAPVRAVRERFGDDTLLQVDANAAYARADARHLAGLDAFDLLLIEQPLDEEDLLGHAALARSLRTPICLDAPGVPVWCGGMLEPGLGRAGNAALAALPNFTLPGDVSASDRYYTTDITEPFVLRDGHLTVPTEPGLGVTPIPSVPAEVTTAVSESRRR